MVIFQTNIYKKIKLREEIYKLSGKFPSRLETFYVAWKVSRSSGKFPIVWKVFLSSGKFPIRLITFLLLLGLLNWTLILIFFVFELFLAFTWLGVRVGWEWRVAGQRLRWKSSSASETVCWTKQRRGWSKLVKVDQGSAGACVGECWLERRSIQPWDRVRPDRELLHLLGFYFDENILLWCFCV